jgi:hypothetical protein
MFMTKHQMHSQFVIYGVCGMVGAFTMCLVCRFDGRWSRLLVITILSCFITSDHLIEYGCTQRLVPRFSPASSFVVAVIRLLVAAAGSVFVFLDIYLIAATSNKWWRFSQAAFVIGTFLTAIRGIKYGISGRWGYLMAKRSPVPR